MNSSRLLLFRVVGIFVLLSALSVSAQSPNPSKQDPDQTPKITNGENFTIVGVVVRRDFLVTNHSTVEEGWVKLVVSNPHGFRGIELSLDDDDKKAQVAQKALSTNAPKTNLFIRLNPGKHKITIGNRPEWILTLIVTPRKK